MYKRSMVVSLIGRPNVGKSSLFNRLMKKGQKAMTYDEPGVTRDRHYGIANFSELKNEPEVETIMVDTGGFYPERASADSESQLRSANQRFFHLMQDQARTAIEESDLVLFVVDVREGILPFDEVICEAIRERKKDFWILANKYDTDKQMGEEAQFYAMGIDESQLFVTSAEHGIGLSQLKERLQMEALAFEKNQDAEERAPLQKGVTPREAVVGRLALIGAPNAGKSTLLNLLVGAERALVSDIPGTTVDPIEGFFDLYFGPDAKLLKESVDLAKHDGLLLQQYENFRKNNAEVFESLQKAYEQEEIASGEIPDDDELIFDEEDEAEDFQGQDTDQLYEQVFGEASESESDEDQILEQDQEQEQGSFWRSVHVVDTAGIRRQKSVEGYIESQSVYRSLRCITESDIVVYLVDATLGIGHQDRRLIDIALEKGRSIIVCLNKVDLLAEELGSEKKKREWLEDLRAEVPWLSFVDLIPISAKYSKGIKALKKSLKKTVLIRRRSLPTGALNRFVFELIERHPITAKKAGGKRFRVKYTSMVKTDPPTFLFFTNKSKGIPDNYRRYLQNALRRGFGLDNTPIHLIFRTGSDLNKRMKKIKANAQ